MIGKKKLDEVRRELQSLLEKLPPSAESWLDREIERASDSEGRDPETLEMLKAALRQAVDKKGRAVSARKA
jgi:chaperonin cofactor prefoldin